MKISKFYEHTNRLSLSRQNRQKTVGWSAFLLIWHSKYSAMESKIHSYRPLFRGFCPLGFIFICL